MVDNDAIIPSINDAVWPQYLEIGSLQKALAESQSKLDAAEARLGVVEEERDEAREGWDYARVNSEEWQASQRAAVEDVRRLRKALEFIYDNYPTEQGWEVANTALAPYGGNRTHG